MRTLTQPLSSLALVKWFSGCTGSLRDWTKVDLASISCLYGWDSSADPGLLQSIKSFQLGKESRLLVRTDSNEMVPQMKLLPLEARGLRMLNGW